MASLTEGEAGVSTESLCVSEDTDPSYKNEITKRRKKRMRFCNLPKSLVDAAGWARFVHNYSEPKCPETTSRSGLSPSRRSYIKNGLTGRGVGTGYDVTSYSRGER